MANYIDLDVNFEKSPMETEELLKEPVFNNPVLTQFFGDIQTGLDKSEVLFHFLDYVEDITRPAVDCQEPTYVTGTDIYQKKLTLCNRMIAVEQCTNVLNNTVWQKYKKKGVEEGDATGTILEEIVTQSMIGATLEDEPTIAFFGDITDNVNPLLSVCDGIWKKIFAGVQANEIPHFNVDDNALVADEGVAILKAVLDQADDRLKDDPDAVYSVTGSVYDNIKATYQKNCCTELQFVNLQNGIKVLTYDGKIVVPYRLWDRKITKYTLGSPHRVILANPNNFLMGFEEIEAKDRFKFWFNPEKDKNYAKMKYRAGVLIKFNRMVSVSY